MRRATLRCPRTGLNRVMTWISRIKSGLVWALAGAVALLFATVRWQSSRLEERDRAIRQQQSWIDTTRRIQSVPESRDAKEAMKRLKEGSDE